MPDLNKSAGIGGCGILFIMAAVACTFASINVCNYVKLTDTDGTFSRSLWRGQLDPTQGCSSYKGSSIYIDRYWNSARGCAVVAQIFACLGVFSSMAAIKPSKKTMSMATSIAMMACLFEGLTLLFLKSSACDIYEQNVQGATAQSCSMDQGAKLAIAATVLWFIGGVVMVCSTATSKD